MSLLPSVFGASIAAAQIILSPAALSDGVRGTPYSQTLTASGGVGPYSFGVSAGTLPAGMSFNSGGVLSGTPTDAGPFNFTVVATDTASNTGSQVYNVVISAPTITLSPTSLPGGMRGTPYSQTLTASGGVGPYSFGVSAGTLPAGMSFNSGGMLSGTPTDAGPFNFTVVATDTASNTGSQVYNVVISAPTITLSPTSLPGGMRGTPYSQTLTASGGIGPYSFGVSAGTLPAGMSFNSSGVLSGTPSDIGTFSFTVVATDTASNTGSLVYSVVISAATITVSPATLPNGVRGAAFSQTLTASGGAGPYVFALVAGTLPTGVAFSSGGIFSGSLTTNGPYNFTIEATDTVGNTGSQAYAVIVSSGTTTVLSSSLNPSVAGQVVTFTATVTSPDGPPVGTVIFNDGASVLGTAPLAGGIATLTTSALSAGSHGIIANFVGSGGFGASSSPVLMQTVNVPADSLKLRALQIAVTKIVAQNSGQAIAGAVDRAISEGFSDSGAMISPSGVGLRFNFAGDADQPATPRADSSVLGRNGGSGEGGCTDTLAVSQKPRALTMPLPRSIVAGCR